MTTTTRHPRPKLAATLLCLISAATSTTVPAAPPETITAGAGSISTRLAPACKPLPAKIFKTPAVDGPTVTGQWWSSLLWQQFSSNMFPHPLGMVCTPDGLAISYPGIGLVAGKDAIMGSGVSKQGDLKIGLAGQPAFQAAACAGYSDWFVTAEFSNDQATLATSFGHGSPFVFCTYTGAKPEIRFTSTPRIWSGTAGDSVLGLTSRGCHYAIFAPTGSSWTGLDTNTITNHSGGKNYLTIALLPDDKPATLALFKRYAYSPVVDTRLVYSLAPGKVKAAYQFTTKPWEGTETGTIFALYPHQWKYTANELTGHSYKSVRGEMKVATGTGFTTEIPVQGVLPMLPPQGIKDRQRMLEYLRREAQKSTPPFADTYWEGKYLGTLATLSGIAEAAAAPELRNQFITEIKRRLEDWFTATPGENGPHFYYNSTWGALVGTKPSYGSDMPLNDHHFHYGYFIRAAAEVARIDREWAEKWEPMVMMIIRDIASPNRHDTMFPFIRCFDKYAGHSWASGDANFADGNNQESSSESMNAWYGMMLWGEATGNDTVRDTGIALFNTERTAVEEYWFDVSDTNFPESFPQVALGMVWGGKGAFATWFSGEIDCIHGINWLPFTPASIYMGRHPDYVKKNYDRIVEKRQHGDNFNNGWGDLVVMFGALSDPAAGTAYLDANPSCSLEGGNTHAFMYHWLHTLNTLGLNDPAVVADHPFSNVFTKNGKRSYAAYNYNPTPLTVFFSDGKKLTVPPHSIAVDH
ncbi:MAG: glycosyl hydrolase [Verrucomicrobiota bacterium JB025]|nr:glycosyl hydrolase [Verrucomicrobiota bacterium JB025]